MPESAPQSPEESNRIAREFHSRLRELVAPYPPHRFAPEATHCIRAVLHMGFNPSNVETAMLPHFLLHAIEANCVYGHGYTQRGATLSDLSRINNHYAQYEDPYFKHLLDQDGNPTLGIMALIREQRAWQDRYTSRDLGRDMLLFLHGYPLRKSKGEFESKKKMTLRDWFHLIYLTNALVSARSSGKIGVQPGDYRQVKNGLSSAGVPVTFLQSISQSPTQVRHSYTRSREGMDPFLHKHVPSTFLDFPGLSLPGGILFPHPGYLFRHGAMGVFRALGGSDVFRMEFGRSFERHVQNVLEHLPMKCRLLGEPELLRAIRGRVCDFLIEEEEAILLVESKAVVYKQTLITDRALKGASYFRQVAKGLLQVLNTAKAVRAGALRTLLENDEKPIFGIVVTYGEFWGANALPVQRDVVLEHLRRSAGEIEDWPHPLAAEPQVLSIRDLEMIVALSDSHRRPVNRTIREKLAQDYHHVGDWPAYLPRLFTKAVNKSRLHQTLTAAFLEQMDSVQSIIEDG